MEDGHEGRRNEKVDKCGEGGQASVFVMIVRLCMASGQETADEVTHDIPLDEHLLHLPEPLAVR